MTWFKVDDKLHDHRKARAAGCAAMGLWTMAGSWAADNLTDGFVPDSVAARWDRSYRRLAARLVEVGLWVEDFQHGEQGWSFHEWSDGGRQPTRERVLAERAAAQERMAKVRQRRRSGEHPQNVRAKFDRGSSSPTRPDPPPTEGRVGCGAPDCVNGWLEDDKGDAIGCPKCNPQAVVIQLREAGGVA